MKTAAFRDPRLAPALVAALGEEAAAAGRPLRFMEICGGHTVALFRAGIHRLLPDNVSLVSGPGCPVCVTPAGLIDRAAALAAGATLYTFGDLLRVPGNEGSLEEARARGGDVRVVYSPEEALAGARDRPGRPAVFFGIGFETTAPALALTVKRAAAEGRDNFRLLSALKLTPPAMRALVAAGEIALDGFLCPGHVTTVIGSEPYRFLADEFKLPAVVAGFEPLDLLEALRRLCRQAARGEARVEIAYRRSVSPGGNRRAQALVAEVFAPVPAAWRGLGVIPESGLALRADYAAFAVPDGDEEGAGADPPGCACGRVLRGLVSPPDCPRFGRGCTPERPLGPCMVAAEGACQAHYRYRHAASGGGAA